MRDPFGRTISYLRISVTDRCDLRCFYCMSENMHFLPKRDLLTLEELDRLCTRFITKGIRRLRITGGEPLVRRDVMRLFHAMSRHLQNGRLDDLALTTNGTQLARFASELHRAGVKRVNISLDSRDPQTFARITRWGRLNQVLDGIDAADAAGLKIKINMVALKGINHQEIEPMMVWAHGRGFDLSLIETMPMGDTGYDRTDQYLSLAQVKAELADSWTLQDSTYRTGGPARYVHVAETGGRLGFITPLSHNFCQSCNRVRLTCTGTLYPCLGQETAVDLRQALRASDEDHLIDQAIDRAIAAKPEGHDFAFERHLGTEVQRHMSVTGG